MNMIHFYIWKRISSRLCYDLLQLYIICIKLKKERQEISDHQKQTVDSWNKRKYKSAHMMEASEVISDKKIISIMCS
jgi:hypothetical protein